MDAGEGPTAGFVCYKKEVLESINFDEINFVRLRFPDRNEICSLKLGFKVIEILLLLSTASMALKMNKNISEGRSAGVLKIQWLSMFKNYRRKVQNNYGAGSNRSCQRQSVDFSSLYPIGSIFEKFVLQQHYKKSTRC